MEILLELSKNYSCTYAKSNKDKKSVFKQNTIEDMSIFFGNKDTIVDCGMATTGLIVMYFHRLINPSELDDITKVLTDPNNKDEHFFTIPTDGVIDKNMLLRLLPKNESVDSSIIKIRYFRTNYLQDNILNLNLGWSSTSWGMWCIELGQVVKIVPDEFLYSNRDSYTSKTILYLFFNGKDDRFNYNWVVGSKTDIEKVTYDTCIRDMDYYLYGFKSSSFRKSDFLKEKDIFDNCSKSLINNYRAIIQKYPDILDVQIQPIHTHVIDTHLDLDKILLYLSSYVISLIN